MFCDSEIASKISSARTKSEAIVNNALAPHSLKEVLKIINDNNISFIGVCTDGSNHCGHVIIKPSYLHLVCPTAHEHLANSTELFFI